MGEASGNIVEQLAPALAALGWRLPRVRDPALVRRWAFVLHGALADVANGRGALDIAIGEGLAALNVGLRAMALGYSNIHDYAREELGINASTAAKMERLARRLRELPLIRQAVRCGLLTTRKAEITAPVAKGNEVYWLARAQELTVRALKAEVKGPPDPDAERWVNLSIRMPPEQRPVVDVALGLAGMVLEKPTASVAERIAAWCQESMSSGTPPPDDRVDDLLFTAEDDADVLLRHLEEVSGGWKRLDKGVPVKAPEESGETDPWRLDREIKGHVETRKTWDDAFGHLAMLFQSIRGWDHLGFGSFGQYCEEALGMSERTVAQRASLERGLVRNPLLRTALVEGRISYEKARLIARDATAEQVPQWIERAEHVSCIDLRRELQQKSEAQMCARGELSVWMPESIATLLKGTFRALRAAAKRWMWAEQCFFALAMHFIEVYRHLLTKAQTLQQRIAARDGHRCQVPRCSRPSAHAHHIIPKSKGGTDDDWNLVSLCVSHHLNGIHGGHIRVSGRAPDALEWKINLRRSYAETAVL